MRVLKVHTSPVVQLRSQVQNGTFSNIVHNKNNKVYGLPFEIRAKMFMYFTRYRKLAIFFIFFCSINIRFVDVHK